MLKRTLHLVRECLRLLGINMSSKKPTIILVNDTDHLTYEHANVVFGILNAYSIPFTHATFYKLDSFDEYPDSTRSLAKHCWPRETAGFVGEHSSEYIKLLKDQINLGNEIAYHGYSQISNTREQFLEGIESINSILGTEMETYIEHGGNPSFHPIEGCKKETLACQGRDNQSQYYVEDKVCELFKQSWCYFDLINPQNKLSEQEICDTYKRNPFFKKDNTTMMTRYRAKDVIKLIKNNMVKNNDVVIAYTHFGYRGYPKGTLLESWWNIEDIKRNCSTLSRLREFGFNLTTIKQYCGDNEC